MEISINQIKLFQILKEKLGDKEAEALVTFVEAKVKAESEQNLKALGSLASKEDLLKTKVDLIKCTFSFFVVLMLAIIGIYFKK
jgi:hypothetical protein